LKISDVAKFHASGFQLGIDQEIGAVGFVVET
jgi:hypothetical protein